MLPSGNDAAQALAENLGNYLHKHTKYNDLDFFRRMVSGRGNLSAHQAFLSEMNYNAQLLGLTSSFYVNPHGLVNKLNRSSALDVALVFNDGMAKYSLFSAIVSCK